MYKEILQSIAGITTFPIVGLALFVTVFVGVTIWAIRLDKKRVTHMSELPLDDPEQFARIGE